MVELSGSLSMGEVATLAVLVGLLAVSWSASWQSAGCACGSWNVSSARRLRIGMPCASGSRRS